MTDIEGPPLLTVALPVYNGENFLEFALRSIMAQTFRNFELVVSDNSSTDRTGEILAAAAAADPRIKVSRSPTLLPQAANIDRAVRLASTPWVKLICHDDLMEPDCLEEVAAALHRAEKEGVGLIGNSETWLFANGARLAGTATSDGGPILTSGKKAVLGSLGSGGARLPLPSITTATVRKRAYEESGGFDGRFVHFDVFLWMKLLTKWNYIFLPKPLTVNRIHGGQVAVAARRQLRSVTDFKLFMPQFLREHGRDLGISKRLSWKVRLKPAAILANTMVIDLLKGNRRRAFQLALLGPKSFLPILPLLILRSYRIERAKLSKLSAKVSIEQVYPG